MSEIKLLQCPFCGGEARLIKNDDGCAVVSCLNGSCNGNACCYKYDIPEEAVEAWNNRKPVDDVLERMEKINSDEIIVYGGRYSGKTFTAGFLEGIKYAMNIIKEGMMRCE